MTDDLEERKDLAQAPEHQALLTRMLRRYKQLAVQLSAPNGDAGGGRLPPSPAACAAMEAAGDWWVPWGDD